MKAKANKKAKQEMLQAAFTDFMRKVHSGGVRQHQWDSMKLAFFAGAHITLSILFDAFSEDDDADMALDVMDKLHNELEKYFTSKTDKQGYH